MSFRDMRSSFLIISIFITFLSCKKSTASKQSPETSVSTSIDLASNYIEKLQTADWEDLVVELFLGSSAPINYTVFKKQNIYALIDETTPETILAKINYQTDVNDMPLKWVKIDFSQNKFYDVTNGEDAILELSFNQKVFEILKEKYFGKDIKIQEEAVADNKQEAQQKKVSPNCYETQDGYDYIKTCSYPLDNNSIQSIYETLAKSKEFKEEELLLPMPIKDTVLNDEGKLTSLRYIVSKNSMRLDINYSGGVTYIVISKEKDSIKLVKTYSSD